MTLPRGLRADAQRNRDALVEAAREVMGRRGLDAPLDEIAQVAGVGNATLYRRFPTREDLIAAVFAEEMTRYAAAGVRALAEPDPWLAVQGHLTEVCRLQAEHRALADLVTSAAYTDPDRPAVVARLQQVLDRARDAGVLRRDATVEDVVLALLANAGVLRRTAEHAPAASPRLVSLLLDGLRAPGSPAAGSSPAAAPPVDPDALERALVATSTTTPRGES